MADGITGSMDMGLSKVWETVKWQELKVAVWGHKVLQET